MRRMVRWNPYRELAALERTLSNGTNGGRVWRPALDVIENDDAYIVRAAFPGFKAEDVTIKVEDDVLTLQAQHSQEHEEEGENYLLRERAEGSFRRSVRLPEGVNADEANADITDGILTLTLPKREEYKPREIEVTVK